MDTERDTVNDSWPYESDSDRALFDALSRFVDLFGWELVRRDPGPETPEPLETWARRAGLAGMGQHFGTLS